MCKWNCDHCACLAKASGSKIFHDRFFISLLFYLYDFLLASIIEPVGRMSNLTFSFDLSVGLCLIVCNYNKISALASRTLPPNYDHFRTKVSWWRRRYEMQVHSLDSATIGAKPSARIHICYAAILGQGPGTCHPFYGVPEGFLWFAENSQRLSDGLVSVDSSKVLLTVTICYTQKLIIILDL